MPHKLNLPMAEIIALYESGETADAIGAAYGCSNFTILKRLRGAGVEIRCRGWRRGRKRRSAQKDYDFTTVSARMTRAEAESVKSLAALNGQSVAAYAADVIRDALDDEGASRPASNGHARAGFFARMWGAR